MPHLCRAFRRQHSRRGGEFKVGRLSEQRVRKPFDSLYSQLVAAGSGSICIAVVRALNGHLFASRTVHIEPAPRVNRVILILILIFSIIIGLTRRRECCHLRERQRFVILFLLLLLLLLVIGLTLTTEWGVQSLRVEYVFTYSCDAATRI